MSDPLRDALMVGGFGLNAIALLAVMLSSSVSIGLVGLIGLLMMFVSGIGKDNA